MGSLKQDLVNAFNLHSVGMLRLSALSEIHGGLVEKVYEVYGQIVNQWATNLLAGTELPQVAVYTDAHNVTIADQDLVTVAESNFISGFMSEQPERSFPHVRVRLCGHDTRGPVITCPVPSSNKRG